MFTKELERLFNIQKKRRREAGRLGYAYHRIRIAMQSEAVLTAENVEKVVNAPLEATRNKEAAHLTEIAKQAVLPQESVKAILEALQREAKPTCPHPETWKLC
ncbi:MAG: hypothetical protein QW166_02945 [Candidatus Bathyarchaeia archaeon]